MNCSICNEKITADPYGWTGGCNAQPINDGTCCHECDENIVLPYRIALAFRKDKHENTRTNGRL